MSVNDTTIQGAEGPGVYPGVANPHSCAEANPMQANFVLDPTTEIRGAGAGSTFAGGKDAARAVGREQSGSTKSAGVVEARPGIIESTHIDPRDERSLTMTTAGKTNAPGPEAAGKAVSNGEGERG